MEILGRKWTMIFLSIPLLLGNLFFFISYYVESAALIYCGRVLTGFGGGAFSLTAPVYIVEIAVPELRGSLSTMFQLMLSCGITFVHALNINNKIDWYIISAILMGPAGKK